MDHISQRLNRITEKTLIPVSLVLVIVGGIFWLTTVYYQGMANASALTELKTYVDHQNDQVRSDISSGFEDMKKTMADDRKVTMQILFEIRQK